MTLYEVAEEISRRLGNIFLRDKDGRQAVYGATRKFQEDPHWRDLIPFYGASTVTTAPDLGPATRPAGRASSRARCSCLPRRRPSRLSNWARPQLQRTIERIPGGRA